MLTAPPQTDSCTHNDHDSTYASSGGTASMSLSRSIYDQAVMVNGARACSADRAPAGSNERNPGRRYQIYDGIEKYFIPTDDVTTRPLSRGPAHHG